MRLSFILDLSPSHRREAESETDPDERIWERICYILLSNGVLYFVSSSNVVMYMYGLWLGWVRSARCLGEEDNSIKIL